MIYYLNKEFDGGQLRIYENKNTLENVTAAFVDVDPVLNTLVIFRRSFVVFSMFCLIILLEQ
jgi:Rps23 Pro-64 3,4-dihydroxylase Tpa1-like proline 4-hydroxylase